MAIERMPKKGGRTIPDKPTLSDVVKGTPKGRKAADTAVKESMKQQKKVSKKAKQSEKDRGEKKSRKSEKVSSTGVKNIQKQVKKKRKKRRKQVRVDWNKARTLYVTDASQTYKSISETFNCTASTVEKHAKVENWVSLRKSSGEIMIGEAVKLAAQTNEEANKRHMEQWSEAVELALTRLRYIKKQVEKHGFQPKEMKQVIETLKIATEGERTARGLPNNFLRNQNENKDVNEFADMTDEEIDALINDDEHDTSPPTTAPSKT